MVLVTVFLEVTMYNILPAKAEWQLYVYFCQPALQNLKENSHKIIQGECSGHSVL